jgi:hypothetical protein
MGEPKSTEYFRREDGDQGKIGWLKHGSNVVVGEDAETESQVPSSKRGSEVVDVVDEEVEIGERESGSAEGATKDVREENGDGWVMLEEVVVVVVGGVDGGPGGMADDCGLPSLLRRATNMTMAQVVGGPKPTRRLDCARSWCATGAKAVRRSLRIEMLDVTDP